MGKQLHHATLHHVMLFILMETISPEKQRQSFMCQTQRSLFNVDSLVMYQGLITGWTALVTIVGSAPQYEN